MTLQTYTCHKTVKAAKITGIDVFHGATTLDFDGYDWAVTDDYVTKHNPQIGGYYIEDEYMGFDDPARESFLTSEEFTKAGYTLETD
jgi:hypothetical protein